MVSFKHYNAYKERNQEIINFMQQYYCCTVVIMQQHRWIMIIVLINVVIVQEFSIRSDKIDDQSAEITVMCRYTSDVPVTIILSEYSNGSYSLQTENTTVTCQQGENIPTNFSDLTPNTNYSVSVIVSSREAGNLCPLSDVYDQFTTGINKSLATSL